MGRLGLTYDQVLDTPMPELHAAIDDRHALVRETLEMIFGKGPEVASEEIAAVPDVNVPSTPPPADIMAAFRIAAS